MSDGYKKDDVVSFIVDGKTLKGKVLSTSGDQVNLYYYSEPGKKRGLVVSEGDIIETLTKAQR